MSRDRSNILWICTDQQRFDSVGCYGNEFIETPNIDRLADNGVRFQRAYCQSPVCTPSRASFLTGRYPRTTRCRQNGQSIPPEEELVTKTLDSAGYTCGLAGKLHLSACKPNPIMKESRIDDGYTDFHWSHSAQPTMTENEDHGWPTNGYQQWLREKGVEFDRSPVDGSEYVTTSMPEEHHQTTWCTQQGINFIEEFQNVDAPWLYSVNIFDPHHPFDPPQGYLERYLKQLEAIPLPDYEEEELETKPPYQRQDHEGAYNTDGNYPFTEMDTNDHRLLRAAYWAMIDLIDSQVGRLLSTLSKTGQLENTIVVFMSDHGELLGDHGIYLKGPYFYEPAVRVPLIVSWPAEITGGWSTDALVELVDVAPTLLEAAEVDPSSGVQGKSLLPLLTGEDEPATHRTSVYCEYYNTMPWHEKPSRPYATMIRTERYKLVNIHGLSEGELYDLDVDPSEKENLWSDPDMAEVKMNLLERLSDRMAWTVDPLPERKANW